MDLKSRCPQCKNVKIITIVPSNVGNTFDLSKARCDNCEYRYGDDWLDLV